MTRIIALRLIFLALLSPLIEASIKTYAALGDSYASGDGAGSSRLLPNFDPFCGRFNLSYPSQIFASPDLGIPMSGFENLACGGASTLSVLRSQVPKIGNSEVVTITVGGNEVDFFAVVNACIYEWYPHQECEKEMRRARELVQGKAFVGRYEKMVKGAKKKVGREGRVLVTGYARFFDESSEQCDGVSFSRRNSSNVLTKELRRDVNRMVGMVNDVIKAATEVHGGEYVDIDRLFEGQRFCEEGAKEPSGNGERWFFSMKYQEKHESEQQLMTGPVKDFFDLTRTFHPTADGHKAVADEIIRLIE